MLAAPMGTAAGTGIPENSRPSGREELLRTIKNQEALIEALRARIKELEQEKKASAAVPTNNK
jgi:hypothetical protein